MEQKSGDNADTTLPDWLVDSIKTDSEDNNKVTKNDTTGEVPVEKQSKVKTQSKKTSPSDTKNTTDASSDTDIPDWLK